jgi:hypothetical protein
LEHEGRSRTRKTNKHIEHLATLPRSECLDFFEKSPPETLIEVFEESYSSDLVNLLLDLKKATVRKFLETLTAHRKRGVVEVATLFYYKEYLTNPLPLQVETETGAIVPNYYAILGVPRDVSDEDLKTAHRLLSRAHDPEAFSPLVRKSGEARLAEIEDAYANLKNPPRRQSADRLLPNISYLYPRRDQSWLESVQRLSV